MKKFISPIAIGVLLCFCLFQTACKKSMLSPEDAGSISNAGTNTKGTASLLLTEERIENLGLNVIVNNTSTTVGTGTAMVQFYYNGNAQSVVVKVSWAGKYESRFVNVAKGSVASAYFDMTGIPATGCEVTATVTDSITKTTKVKIGPRPDVYTAGTVSTLTSVSASLDRIQASNPYIYNFNFYWYKPMPNYLFLNEPVYVSIRFYTATGSNTYSPTNTFYGNTYVSTQSLLVSVVQTPNMGPYFRVVAGSNMASVNWDTHPGFNNLPMYALVFDNNGHHSFLNQVSVNGN